ncbi:MAG: hypothetical protein R2789_10145 [Microthrixaceae bacterium]
MRSSTMSTPSGLARAHPSLLIWAVRLTGITASTFVLRQCCPKPSGPDFVRGDSASGLLHRLTLPRIVVAPMVDCWPIRHSRRQVLVT